MRDRHDDRLDDLLYWFCLNMCGLSLVMGTKASSVRLAGPTMNSLMLLCAVVGTAMSELPLAAIRVYDDGFDNISALLFHEGSSSMVVGDASGLHLVDTITGVSSTSVRISDPVPCFALGSSEAQRGSGANDTGRCSGDCSAPECFTFSGQCLPQPYASKCNGNYWYFLTAIDNDTFVGCSAIGQCETRRFADLARVSTSTDIGPRGRYCGDPNLANVPSGDLMIEFCPVWRYVSNGVYQDSAIGVVASDTSSPGAPDVLYLISAMETTRDNSPSVSALQNRLYFTSAGGRSRIDRISKRSIPDLGVQCATLDDGEFREPFDDCIGVYDINDDAQSPERYIYQSPPDSFSQNSTDQLELSLYGRGEVTQHLTGFHYGEFVYFVAQEFNSIRQASVASIGRFCKGSVNNNPIPFNSFTRVEVSCGGRLVAATSVETLVSTLTPSDPNRLLFLLASASGGGPGEVCIISQSSLSNGEQSAFRLTEATHNFAAIGGNSCASTSGNDPNRLLVQQMTASSFVGNIVPSIPQITTFTSITVDQIGDSAVIYLGSMDGFIIQMFLTSNQNRIISSGYRLLSAPQGYVHTLALDINFDLIVAGTEEVLAVTRIENCENFTSCQSCISNQVLDGIYCGWCTLSSSCTTRSQCASEHAFTTQRTGTTPIIDSYFVNYGDLHQACPSVLSATDLLPAGDLAPFNATVAGIPVSLTNDTFFCEIQINDSETGRSVSIGQNIPTGDRESLLVCNPLLSNINVGGTNVLSTNGSLNVRYGPSDRVGNVSNLPILASLRNFGLIFDCGVLSNCTSCTGSNFNCHWCPLSSTCSPSLSLSESCSQFRSLPEECPVTSLTTPSAIHSGDIDVEVLTIQANNLPAPIGSDTYNCRFTRQDDQANSTYISGGSFVSATAVNCSLSTIPSLPGLQSANSLFENGNGVIDYNVEVLVNSISVTVSVVAPSSVSVYSCPAMAQRSDEQDCSRCMSRVEAPFRCGWCSQTSSCSVSQECIGNVWETTISSCPQPEISSIEPLSGPSEGGTLVTITGTNFGGDISNFERISVGGTLSEIRSYSPTTGILVVSTRATNRTSITGIGRPRSYSEIIEIQFSSGTARSTDQFTYVHPSILSVSPNIAPMSGGTIVNISGRHLGAGHAISIWLDNRPCLNVSTISISELSEPALQCTLAAPTQTNSVPSGASGLACIRIDDAVCIETLMESGAPALPAVFTILPDPTIDSFDPQFLIAGGGVRATVFGNNTMASLRPVVKVYSFSIDQAVTITAEFEELVSELQFVTPTLASVAPEVIYSPSPYFEFPVSLQFNFDAAVVVADIVFIANPSVVAVTPRVGSVGSNVQIKGTNLQRGGLPRVYFGSVRAQLLLELSDDSNLVAVAPENADIRSVDISFILGNWSTTYNETFDYVVASASEAPSDSIGIIIAGPVVAGLFLALVIVFALYRYKARKRAKMEKAFLGRMNRLEAQIVDVCKQGFTELQSGTKLTFNGIDSWATPHPIDKFMTNFMFTSVNSHAVPDPTELKSGISDCVEPFLKILKDQRYVLAMTSVIESETDTSIKDKCHVAALLQVVAGDDSDYTFTLLKGLLRNLLASPSTRKHPKLALRRTESIAEKFVSCWLAQELYPHITTKVAQPLWELLQALRVQSQKGPIDAVTGSAMYTLNGVKLLKEHVPSIRIDLSVTMSILGDRAFDVPVTVNNVDTPSQVIHKVLETASHGANEADVVPDPSSVALVEDGWPSNGRLLKDLDSTSVLDTTSGSVRLNTLTHYKINMGSKLKLIANTENENPIDQSPGRRRISSRGQSDLNLRLTADRWHLVHRSPQNNNKKHVVEDGLPAEVYLTYMLTMKGIVQPYIDKMISAMFDKDEIPTSIKKLFDFLDTIAGELGYTDPQILHIWKNNALPLRFWVNLIKNPNFIYDVTVNDTTNSNLSTVAQVIMDACSTSRQELSRNSPVNKLLYNAEVHKYKAQVKNYYETVSDESPRISVKSKGDPGQLPAKYNAAFLILGYSTTYKSKISAELSSLGLRDLVNDFNRCCSAYETRMSGGPKSQSTTESTSINIGYDGESTVVKLRPKKKPTIRSPSGLSNLGYIDVGDRMSADFDAKDFELPDRGSRPESLILGFSEFAAVSEAGSVRDSVVSNFSNFSEAEF